MLHHWTHAELLVTLCTRTVLPPRVLSAGQDCRSTPVVSKTPSVVWHCGTQHVPPLRIKGGDKCHHVLVSFRKRFGYLKSAYKDLEEGPKKPAT